MRNESLWLDNIKFKKPIVLSKDKSVDVLIIGGGLTGLSTAYHLMNSGLSVCLTEKNLIAHGVSANTTGKLTFLQENIYSKLKDKAQLYYESQKDAINIIESIIKENKIKCNYEIVPSFICTDNESEIKKIKKEEQYLKKLNIKYEKSDLPEFIKCKYALKVNGTAVFHPIKYLCALKNILLNNNIDIYENSSVTLIKKEDGVYKSTVNNYTVTSKYVVIASHYPFFLSPLFVPLKTYIEKSYISASIVDKNEEFSAITISKPIKSFRYHEDKENYLIFLNGSHNLCHKNNYKNNFDNLLKDLSSYNLKPAYLWSNHDLMTEDALPYIGFIDDNMLIGTGYNTWGMTNGTLAGKIISDLILNKNNKYESLFDPKRVKSFSSILKYPLYMSYSGKSFIESKIIKNKSWYSDNVRFTKINGKNVGIYRDEFNKEHIVHNICPHLKCSLTFNEIEKTWDCPCHGSRFNIDGKCISGPSKYDIGFKE